MALLHEARTMELVLYAVARSGYVMPGSLTLRSGEIPYESSKIECASKGLYAVLSRHANGQWEQRPFRPNKRLMSALAMKTRVLNKQTSILAKVRETVEAR